MFRQVEFNCWNYQAGPLSSNATTDPVTSTMWYAHRQKILTDDHLSAQLVSFFNGELIFTSAGMNLGKHAKGFRCQSLDLNFEAPKQ